MESYVNHSGRAIDKARISVPGIEAEKWLKFKMPETGVDFAAKLTPFSVKIGAILDEYLPIFPLAWIRPGIHDLILNIRSKRSGAVLDRSKAYI